MMESSEVVEVEIGDQQSVLLKVAGLYASHLLSDISLVVGENRYPAHRVILSASSEVFQCMLLNPQASLKIDGSKVVNANRYCTT